MAKPLPKLVIPPKKASPRSAGSYEWEGALADALGITYSPGVKKFFDAWTTADQSDAPNNPFNITVDYTGTSTGDLPGNSANVKNFPTAVAGINATAAFIQRNVPALVSLLDSGDFRGAANFIGESGWDGGPNAAASVKQGYANSIYSNFENGAYNPGNNVPAALSPKDRVAVSVQQSTETANAKANSPGYNQATTAASAAEIKAKAESAAYQQAQIEQATAGIQVSIARKSAEAELHVNDPWVTVVKNKNGQVTGFGTSTGINAPKNVLMIGGQPATQSVYNQAWTNTYANDFTAYTGKQATPQQQAQILEQGLSVYQMQQQLSKQPGFKTSPVYQANGAGIVDQAKQVLGVAPPPDFVRRAISQNWDADTVAANLKKLSQYEQGPVFKQGLAQNEATYEQIYGTVHPGANAWLKQATLQGWSTDQVGQKLRSDPAYKYSPEYQANAIGFLNAMGLITGTRAVASVQDKAVIKQATAGSKVGGAPLNLQIGVGGQ